jgi:hypothetical protein
VELEGFYKGGYQGGIAFQWIVRWCKFHDLKLTITCFTTYYFTWVSLKIKSPGHTPDNQ